VVFCLGIVTAQILLLALPAFAHAGEENVPAITDVQEAIAILATQASVAINNSRLFDQVQLDLDVKTALLQEINHRVRNNLASIVGLLSMELMRPEPRPAKTVLMNSINRVKSIGQVQAHSQDVKKTQHVLNKVPPPNQPAASLLPTKIPG